jgi:hypothetical protein
MDRTKAKSLLQIVFAKFKELGTELRAYEMTFAALKEALKHDHPDFAALADGSLAAARVSPVLHETMRQQYDQPLETFLGRVSQAETEEEVEKLLLAMPTSKFVN